MDTAARLTSKGQVTIPKSVRDALGLKEGDEVVFRVPPAPADVVLPIMDRLASFVEG